MKTQVKVSLFLKRTILKQNGMRKTEQTSRTKSRLRPLSLANLLLVFLLACGLSLNAWGAPVALAQTTSNGRVAVIGVEAAPLYQTPGGATVQTLIPGTPVTVTGRSEDSQWVQIDDSTLGKGWMAAQQLIIFGVDSLPVVAVASAAVDKVATQTTTTPITVQTTDTPTVTTSAVTTPTVGVITVAAQTSPGTSTVTTTVAPAPTAEAVITSSTPTTDSTAASLTITAAGLNVRAGPGTNYAVVTKVTAGQTYPVQARNGASNWLQITLANDQLGWVSAQYVKLTGAVNALPVSTAVSAAPVGQATPTAAATASVAAAEPVVQTASTAPVTRIAPPPVAAASAAGLQGTLVFETSNGGTIYAYNLASGALHQLTGGYDPAISPDGSRVAFTRIGGENGVYVINIDGSNERKIYSGNETLSSPKWSPDGNWIVFSQVAATYTCYQMGPQCLTRTDLKKRLPPAQANDPDALDKLLKNPDIEVNQNPLWGIARVDVNGQNYRDIVALNSARSPDWSNSGIVYQSADGLQKTADKSDAVNQLVLGEHYVQDPDWQPNGGRIVYQSRQGPHWEIFAVNDDGTGQVALTHPEMTLVDQLPSNVAPAWSPDGQHIVFLSNRQDNSYEAGAWRIWVMNADGTNPHPLPINVALDYGYTDEQMVSWGG
ncbi:MAG: SH3 domain-containing protein [Chloroflexi bacterium]|nr:SH3 domain-containing protein [Chloroflexota bacterium]